MPVCPAKVSSSSNDRLKCTVSVGLQRSSGCISGVPCRSRSCALMLVAAATEAADEAPRSCNRTSESSTASVPRGTWRPQESLSRAMISTSELLRERRMAPRLYIKPASSKRAPPSTRKASRPLHEEVPGMSSAKAMHSDPVHASRNSTSEPASACRQAPAKAGPPAPLSSDKSSREEEMRVALDTTPAPSLAWERVTFSSEPLTTSTMSALMPPPLLTACDHSQDICEWFATSSLFRT
mmetsp:Transcript_29736/g.74727  ORF Transcript_29736/g.74727 Transcript_29736/m.74727 type:complete len:239 (+) Transcript_29736:1007-1723(+)